MKKNNKGFTLAELLIVVAIIAVLVAIAIPIFTSQLEKSRDAVTVSNLRSAYAMAQTSYLTQQSDATNGVTYNAADKTVSVTGVKAKGTTAGFSGAETELPFTAPADMGGTKGTYTVTFNYATSESNPTVSATRTGD